MEMQQIIEQAKQNIRQALSDYRAHTRQTYVIDDVSDEFISRLAIDSSYAKQELRELFSKSPVWDENLDALVINGTRTHNPDPNVVRNLALEILLEAYYKGSISAVDRDILAEFFVHPDSNPIEMKTIMNIAPKAYAPGKKLSRVFKSLCSTLGIADDTAGSQFQRLYAQFADELSARKINFKLFVSINPAHFLTMSNPKYDERGCTLTSCHSFNATDYEYNNGCSGYARDKYTFIVFTVDNSANPESLNNRKTTRQIFAYKPGNGLLLQSRLYNTSGGTRGAQEESKIYRDLIQREISMLEDAANLWKTYKYLEFPCSVRTGDGFGGYADWEYEDFDGKISIRTDHTDDYEPLEVGTYGLCIACGEECTQGLYCEDCASDEDSGVYCDDCGDWVDSSEVYTVFNSAGHEISVCEDCRDRLYTLCDECGGYYPNDDVHVAMDADGYSINVCNECLDEKYTQCDRCDDFHRDDEMTQVMSESGEYIYVCPDCLREFYIECDECGDYYDKNLIESVCISDNGYCKDVCESCRTKKYEQCTDCGEWFSAEMMRTVYDEDGTERRICANCVDGYEICPNCGEYIENCDDRCPACGAAIETEKEVEAV